MPRRIPYRVVLPTALLVLAGALPGLNGWARLGLARPQAGARPDEAKPGAAGEGRPGESSEEKAIRAVDEAFVGEYNRGDSKALAARFAEDAEVVEAEGDRFEGRDLIERGFAETFAAGPGARIELEIGSIRFLGPDAAQERGRSRVTPAKGGTPVDRLYTALYVRRDGRWLIAGVREEVDPVARPHDRLKDLAWMVGQWVDEGPDSVVHVDCRWSDDGNFLLRAFTVKRRGRPVMTVSQRIGWDPLARRVRSWEFDSEGGFGEGTWSRSGDGWVVKHTAVRPEGTTASATNILTRERPDLVRWASTDRVVGDEAVPDETSYVLVRVPPPPGLKTPATPSPDAERSPR